MRSVQFGVRQKASPVAPLREVSLCNGGALKGIMIVAWDRIERQDNISEPQYDPASHIILGGHDL